MKAEFIHHSSVYIETEHNVLIFDYVNGNNEKFDFKGNLPEIPTDKSLYFFVSHAHSDHYDPCILDIQKNRGNCYIVADKSVGIGKSPLLDSNRKVSYDILKVDYNKKYRLNDISIKTIKSTEIGVAFIVKVDDANIFFAGDLALWYWDGVGELINGKETSAYKREINKIRDEHFDIACVPLDPRMKGHTGDGMMYFMENVDCDTIIPIHTWGDYECIDKFKARCSNSAFAGRLCSISHENEILKND